VASRRLAPWIIAAVLCAAGSLGAHALGYWLEPAGASAAAGHAWLDLLPAFVVAGVVALFASLAVETREILRHRPSDSVPSWLFLVLPAAAFLVQEHVERAAATARLPVDTLAQPAVLAGLALQLPFGLVALLAARLLTRATVAVARRIGRRTRPHPARADQRHDRTDPCPRRVELLQPSGRGPPAFAVP
jgi:membrane protein implicated in regulation of membrane protease activity